MNSLIFTRANSYIKFSLGILLVFFQVSAHAEWKIDLSRRQKDIRQQEMNRPMEMKKEKGFFGQLFSAETPANDVVILNTERGFVPGTIRVRKDTKYKIHIVNVNESEKNVSFILDAFSEHHSTFYGNIKSFEITPRKEGVYSFQCPETSLEGRVVVFQPEGMVSKPIRFPANTN